MATPEAWTAIKDYVLDRDRDGSSIVDLQDERLLDPEALDFPSYGHETRREVALDWTKSNVRARTRVQATHLVESASQRITCIDPKVLPSLLIVISVFGRVRDLGLAVHVEALALCCASLLGKPLDTQAREKLLDAIPMLAANNSWGPLVAMALANSLIDAKQEDQLERRDQLLEEIRALAQGHPQDQAVREQLATALFNTVIDAKQEDQLERRDQLLEEIRALAQGHPQDQAVRERLAKALFNTVIDAKQEDQLERRDQLLEEIRALAQGHPQDQAVREQLAKALANTVVHAKQEDQLERRDQLLEEIRALAQGHPQDQAVREQLAKALANTVVHAKQEDQLERKGSATRRDPSPRSRTPSGPSRPRATRYGALQHRHRRQARGPARTKGSATRRDPSPRSRTPSGPSRPRATRYGALQRP